MADASDDPEDLVKSTAYSRKAGLRFWLPLHAGRPGPRLPALEVHDQPPRQLVHPPPLPPPLRRHHQRLQGVQARGGRDDGDKRDGQSLPLYRSLRRLENALSRGDYQVREPKERDASKARG
jgi:hypothetical protein